MQPIHRSEYRQIRLHERWDRGSDACTTVSAYESQSALHVRLTAKSEFTRFAFDEHPGNHEPSEWTDELSHVEGSSKPVLTRINDLWRTIIGLRRERGNYLLVWTISNYIIISFLEILYDFYFSLFSLNNFLKVPKWSIFHATWGCEILWISTIREASVCLYDWHLCWIVQLHCLHRTHVNSAVRKRLTVSSAVMETRVRGKCRFHISCTSTFSIVEGMLVVISTRNGTVCGFTKR